MSRNQIDIWSFPSNNKHSTSLSLSRSTGQTWKPKTKATFALWCISLIAFDVILSAIIRQKTTVAVLSLLSLASRMNHETIFVPLNRSRQFQMIVRNYFSLFELRRKKWSALHKQFAGAISRAHFSFSLCINSSSFFLSSSSKEPRLISLPVQSALRVRFVIRSETSFVTCWTRIAQFEP